MTQGPNNRGYDLEERTAKFGESVVEFCNGLKLTVISTPIVSQLIRSSTSVGANYTEANNASSKKDFRNKIYICKKEVEESKHWLRMLVKCYAEHKECLRDFWREAQELAKIFQKIANSLNG
jgi:four helix bundle protein